MSQKRLSKSPLEQSAATGKDQSAKPTATADTDIFFTTFSITFLPYVIKKLTNRNCNKQFKNNKILMKNLEI
jgi:hypothetical protein